MITTVLFDLDGTLLPMDMEQFTKAYFKRLAAKAAPYGYEPEALIKTVWTGTADMVKNDGACTNEEAFWRRFAKIYGEEALKDRPLFDEFYREEFSLVREDCGFTPLAKETVEKLKAAGYRVALATNPIFPAVATESRIGWAGLSPSDFEYYTCYENSVHCKPNPEYYRDVLGQLNAKAEECLMVGNDAEEDTAAEQIGMQVFLLTDCLINKQNRDLTPYPRGGFPELQKFLKL